MKLAVKTTHKPKKNFVFINLPVLRAPASISGANPAARAVKSPLAPLPAFLRLSPRIVGDRDFKEKDWFDPVLANVQIKGTIALLGNRG